MKNKRIRTIALLLALMMLLQPAVLAADEDTLPEPPAAEETAEAPAPEAEAPAAEEAAEPEEAPEAEEGPAAEEPASPGAAFSAETKSVDNATTLRDGRYACKLKYTADSGAAKLTVKSVLVRDGHAFAELRFDDTAYTKLDASGRIRAGKKGVFSGIPVSVGGETELRALNGKTGEIFCYSLEITISGAAGGPIRKGPGTGIRLPGIPDAVANLKQKLLPLLKAGAAAGQEAAQPFAYDGDALNFINSKGEAFGMFTPQAGTGAVLSGDKVEITFYPKNTTVYAGFYLNADISDKDTWDEFIAVGGDGNYFFELDASYCGKAWPIAPVKKSDMSATTSGQYYMAVPAADKLPSAEQTELAVTNNTSMFKIADTALLEQAGGTAKLTVSFTTDTFTKAYFGYAVDAETAEEEDLIAREGDGFTFRLSKDALEKPFVVSFMSSKGWKSQRQFTVDAEAATLTVDEAPEKTTATELAVTNNTSMFKIADTALLEQEDGAAKLTVSFTTDTFTKAYFGYAEDAEKAPESELIAREGDSFTFTLTADALAKPFVVSFMSSKGWKSQRQFTVNTDAATLTVDTAPEKPAATELAVTNNTSMFKIADTALLAQENGAAKLTVSFTTDTFTKAYYGYAEDAEKAPESELIAREGDSFTFTLTADALAKPFVVSFMSSKGWKSQRQFTVNTDAATLTVDTAPEKPAATELAVTNNTSMFKIADTALLAQENGAAKLTVSFTTDTFTKAYYGYAEDAEKAPESELIAREGDDFTFDLLGSALTTPFVVSFMSSKGWKSQRQFTIDTDAATLTVDTAPEKPDEGGDEEEEQKDEGDTNGTTARVDNSTTLPDGTYTPDKFSWSGGSGRVNITCEKVIVQGGKAYAVITINSSKYVYIKASGQTFYTTHSGNTSSATIPVKLNVTNTIIGMTTAMSVPHEIKYSLYIYIAAAEQNKDTTDREDQKIPGLTYLSTDENADAAGFSVYRYEDGYAVIRVAGVGRYLVVPEGREVPEPLDADVYVVKQPVKQAYVSDEERFTALWDAADGILREKLTMTGFDRGGDETKNVGAYDGLDLAQLLRSRCGLAVLPALCADCRVTGWDAEDPEAVNKDELTDEKADELALVFSALQGYGIPGFVDRSADEETEAGALEWLKLYGILFGCEESMTREYEALAAELKPAA